ncbi:MAG TPA: WG repeat-containing protein, partial [Chitinophagaceae bacterium]|nr:WG repeat-containing protein [Chitinophagaceae bacterium]
MPRICTIAAVVVLFAACRQAGPPAISPAVAFEKARIRLEPLFNMVDSFSAEGLARVSSFTDSSTYIDSNGKQLIAYKYNVQPFYEGLGLVEESETGPFYYIDKAGKKVVEL